MGVIFVLSSLEGIDSGSGRLRFGITKFGHVAVYFVLGALIDRAMGIQPVRRQAWWVMVLLVSYAITDEIHQSLVPGRTPLLFDLVIDGAGGLAGIVAWRRVFQPRLVRRANVRAGPGAPPGVSGSPAAGSDTGTARR
jgi:VanZ family protein